MGFLSSVNPTVAGIVVFLLALQLLVLRSAGFSLNDTIQTTPQQQNSPLSDSHVHVGAWGPASSSVNWCEADYVYSRYVAEFWNTLSSLCMAIVGIYGRLTAIESTSSQKERGVYHPLLSDVNINGQRRVKWTWIALEVVGWGSVLFHGSLSWHTQALDEVPMVYTVSLLLTTLATSRFMRPALNPTLAKMFEPVLPAKRTGDGLRVGLLSRTVIVYTVICAFLTTFFRGPLQFVIFHSLFGLVQWSSVILFIWIFVSRKTLLSFPGASREENVKSAWQRHHEANVKRLFLTGGIMYITAVSIWLVDLHGCEYMTNHGVPIPYYTAADGFGFKYINPQGHAIWHLLVSLGFYHLNVLAGYDRMVEGWTVYGQTKKAEKDGEKSDANKEAENEVEAIDGVRPDIVWWKGVVPLVRLTKGGLEGKKVQ